MRGIMRVIAKGLKRLFSMASPPTVATLSGFTLTAIGLWMVYPPLAYIVPGSMLLAFGLWLAGVSLPKRGE